MSSAARRRDQTPACVKLGIPALVDHVGAGGTFAVSTRRYLGKELTVKQRPLNKAHARLRYPVERGMATLKGWCIFRHAHCSPNHLTSTAKVVLTLEQQR